MSTSKWRVYIRKRNPCESAQKDSISWYILYTKALLGFKLLMQLCPLPQQSPLSAVLCGISKRCGHPGNKGATHQGHPRIAGWWLGHYGWTQKKCNWKKHQIVPRGSGRNLNLLQEMLNPTGTASLPRDGSNQTSLRLWPRHWRLSNPHCSCDETPGLQGRKLGICSSPSMENLWTC